MSVYNSESELESLSDDSSDSESYLNENELDDVRETEGSFYQERDEFEDDRGDFGETRDEFEDDRDDFGETRDDFQEGIESGIEKASELEAERDAFDRTSGIHTLLANCGKYTGNKTLQNNLTYEEIIACDINKVFNNYRKDREDSIISKEDLYSLLDDIDQKKIPNIQYKNGLGLLLGYYIFKNGYISYDKDIVKIHSSLVKDSYLSQIMENNIDNIIYPDLIRYTRLWYNIKR